MAIFDFFKDGGRPPSWIFKILIAKILIACRVKMANFRIFATFHGDPSNRCWDMFWFYVLLVEVLCCVIVIFMAAEGMAIIFYH